MRTLLTLFLIHNLLGCTTVKTTKFDGKWAFCEVVPEDEPWACLAQEDVKKLRQELIKCQSHNKN